MDVRKPVDGAAMVMMVLLCLTWSLQQTAMKAASADIAPLLQAGLRAGLAACLVSFLLGLQKRSLWGDGLWRPGLLVGSLYALESLFVSVGLRYTSASHMAVFLYTAPIFTALALHWRFPEERLKSAQWTGVLVAFAGITVMFVGGGTSAGPLLSPWSLFGDFLGMLGGVAWAATTLTIRCSRLAGAAPSQTLLYQLLGAVFLLIPAAFLSGTQAPRFTLLACLCLLFQAVVVCFASYLLWFALLRRYRTSQLGTLAFMTPPFGVLMGVLVLNEPLEPHFLLGAALVLGGVLVVTGHEWWTGRAIRQELSTTPLRPGDLSASGAVGQEVGGALEVENRKILSAAG